MQKYETVKNLRPDAFKRLSGVRKTVFQEMLEVIKLAEVKRSARGGRPLHLAIEDRLLMALEYLREYRTYFHLGQSYGVSESTCYKNCKWLKEHINRERAGTGTGTGTGVIVSKDV